MIITVAFPFSPLTCSEIQGAYRRSDIFEDTAILCQSVNKQVGEIFSSPETVMAKLIQNIFEVRLQVTSNNFMFVKGPFHKVLGSILKRLLVEF